jgi:hypothetical protein
MSKLEDDTKHRVGTVVEDRLGIRGGIDETPSGFCFRLISTRLCVFVHEHAPGHAVVILRAPIAIDVPLSAGLYRHVAMHASDWLYGHLSLVSSSDEVGTVMINHMLAAEYMTDEALVDAVRALADTAESLDDRFVAQFGGHRQYEDV